MLLLGPFSIGLLLLENPPPLQIIFGTRDKNNVRRLLQHAISDAASRMRFSIHISLQKIIVLKHHVLMQLELGIHGALPSGCRIVDATVVHR